VAIGWRVEANKVMQNINALLKNKILKEISS